MSLSEYRKQIREWEQKYGKPKEYNYNFNPAAIRVSCARCGSSRSLMARHHICSDYVFACLLPDIYAARYIQFHPDDVVRLCNNCHKNVEKYYEPIKSAMWHEIYENGTGIVTKEWCEEWKAKFREKYEKWMKTKYKRRKKRKASHRKFCGEI